MRPQLNRWLIHRQNESVSCRTTINQSGTEQAEFATTAYALLQEAKGWRVVVSDSFENDSGRLPIGKESYRDTNDTLTQAERAVTNGKYRWQVPSGTFSDNHLPATVRVLKVSDFYASVDVQRLQGKDLNMGIVFRLNDRGHFVFSVDDKNQTFKVNLNLHESNSKYSTDNFVIFTTVSKAIRPGESNRLTIIAKGSRLILFINDEYVDYADVTYDWDTEGQIGIEMNPVETPAPFEMNTAKDNPAVVEFDNFEVRVP